MGEGTLCTGWATAAAAPLRHLANEPPQPHPGEPSCVRSMLINEVAELTGKAHKNVLADTRKMLAELELAAADFSAAAQVAGPNGSTRTIEVYRLPKRELMVLVTGYSVAPALPRLPRQPTRHV